MSSVPPAYINMLDFYREILKNIENQRFIMIFVCFRPSLTFLLFDFL